MFNSYPAQWMLIHNIGRDHILKHFHNIQKRNWLISNIRDMHGAILTMAHPVIDGLNFFHTQFPRQNTCLKGIGAVINHHNQLHPTSPEGGVTGWVGGR